MGRDRDEEKEVIWIVEKEGEDESEKAERMA